jgi:hypothetical protein
MPVPNYAELAMDVVYAPEDGADLVGTKVPVYAEFMVDEPQNMFIEDIEEQNSGGYHIPLTRYSQVNQICVQVLGTAPLVIRWRDARTSDVWWDDAGVTTPNEVITLCHLDPAYGLYLFCATQEATTRAHIVIYGRR